MNGFGHGFGFGFGPFGLIFWIFIIIGVFWAIRQFSGGGSGTPTDAVEILRQRYARGEIDRAEYEQRLKDLQG